MRSSGPDCFREDLVRPACQLCRRRRPRRGTGCWPRGSSPPRRRRGTAGRRSGAARHRRHRVQQRAGEHHGAAGRRLEARGPNSGKLSSPPSKPSLRLIETAKRRCAVPLVVLSRCGAEMPAVLGGVAGDDVALHPRHLELVHLHDLGHDAPLDARLGRLISASSSISSPCGACGCGPAARRSCRPPRA